MQIAGASDSYIVRRAFVDDDGALGPGDHVPAERAAKWPHLRQLKDQFFISTADDGGGHFRVRRPFSDEIGRVLPGDVVGGERAKRWTEVYWLRDLGYFEPCSSPQRDKAPERVSYSSPPTRQHTSGRRGR